MPIARITATLSLAALCAASLAEPQREGLPTGWEWVFSPRPLGEQFEQHPPLMGSADIVAAYLPGPGQDVFVTIATPAAGFSARAANAEYRAFLLGPDGLPLKDSAGIAVGNGVMSAQRVHFEVDAERFARADLRVGVARMTLDGRIEASLEAHDEAAAKGGKALPLPVLDRRYEFAMPTMDGGVVRSEDLLGKVVVIDSWATWCMPCMQKMPALKALAEKYPDDLAVVGVNFDETVEAAAAELAKGTVPGVHIHAETVANGVEDLWYRATGIRSIPRLFLIDRDGVLVGDINPHELTDRVEALIARTDGSVNGSSPVTLLDIPLKGDDFERAAARRTLEGSGVDADVLFDARRSGDAVAVFVQVRPADGASLTPKDLEARFRLAALDAHGGPVAPLHGRVLGVATVPEPTHADHLESVPLDAFGKIARMVIEDYGSGGAGDGVADTHAMP